MPPHGTTARYKSCDCQPCLDAWAAYYRDYRRRDRDPATIPHGTAYAYRNLGCRCADCTEAQRLKLAAYRQLAGRRKGR
jgi:hypothetical protein